MKLIKCYISSFGNLKNFEYDFNDGLNTIKQENGWGKSTLAGFIKAIFYGLADSKRAVSENERTKFKPWNSTEKFGGFIIFEWKGKEYKIERFFGNKSSEDTVKLYDCETGKEHSKTEDLGKRIFRIDEEGFLSTTYFSQRDFEIKSNSSITAKYNETYEIQDTDKFDNALRILDAKAKELKSRGEKGLIADVKREGFEIKAKIERAENAHQNAVSIKRDIEDLTREVEELSKKDIELRDKVTATGRVEALLLKQENYKKALSTKEKILEEKRSADKILNGNRVNNEKLNDVKTCIRDLSEAKFQKERVTDDIQTLMEEENAKPQPSVKLGLVYFMVAICCALLALGIAGAVLSVPVLMIIGFATGAIALLTTLFLYFKSKSSNKTGNATQSLIEKLKVKGAEYSEIALKYESSIKEFFASFNIPLTENYELSLNIISDALKISENCDRELSVVESEIFELSKEKEIFSAPTKGVNTEELNEQLKTVSDWYKVKSQTLANKKASLKDYENEADSLSDLESRRSDLYALLAEYNHKYNTIVKTIDFLNKADENLRIRYRKPLTDKLNEKLKYVAGNDYVAEIDTDLKVTIQAGGGSRDVDYFSKGFRNLFEICKRLALTDVLFKDEKPFIILDDPFYNLDDEKLSQSIDLIKQLSKEYQILYLICHESRRA